MKTCIVQDRRQGMGMASFSDTEEYERTRKLSHTLSLGYGHLSLESRVWSGWQIPNLDYPTRTDQQSPHLHRSQHSLV